MSICFEEGKVFFHPEGKLQEKIIQINNNNPLMICQLSKQQLQSASQRGQIKTDKEQMNRMSFKIKDS